VGTLQCPCCFSPLEVRDVTPCDVCGGWPESITRFNTLPVYSEYRFPSGHTVVLCQACVLEEFMVPSGWGYRLALGEGLPINSLQRVRAIQSPRIRPDKFCETCNLRLSFAIIVADIHKQAAPRSSLGDCPS
jgi:hypothetical protein